MGVTARWGHTCRGREVKGEHLVQSWWAMFRGSFLVEVTLKLSSERHGIREIRVFQPAYAYQEGGGGRDKLGDWD